MNMKRWLLILLMFASDEHENVLKDETKSGKKNGAEQPIVVKIEEDEYVKVNKKTSNYIGVTKNKLKWGTRRWSKNEKKNVANGSFKDEETAAHASDTLARKLMANGEKVHKLNFPDDDTEVYPEEVKFSSNYIGVRYRKDQTKWYTYRWSKKESKNMHNGSFKDEKTAAHASDTLARKLMANDDKGHKLNFPDDDTEMFREQKTNYIGVSYNKFRAKWCAYRRSKKENKNVYNGSFKDEETAAHASDTLARKLIANGEIGHELNFPDDETEVYPEEVKFSSNYIGVRYHKDQTKWGTHRWSKNEKKTVYSGFFKDEETAARASDNLARKLITNGEKGHKLNFPDDTEVHAEEATYQKKKRKRPNNLGNSQETFEE